MSENLQPIETKKAGKGQAIASLVLFCISLGLFIIDLVMGIGLIDLLHPDTAGEALVLIFIIALFAVPIVLTIIVDVLSIIGACLAGKLLKLRDSGRGLPAFLLVGHLALIFGSILFLVIVFNSGKNGGDVTSATQTTTTVINTALLFVR